MAVARTGSISVVQDGSNASSVSVTVPTASLAVLFVAGYYGAVNLLSTPGAAPTIGGQTMTLAKAGDAENFVSGVAYYLKDPVAGTKTYAWDWGGTGNSSTGGIHFIVYYTGTNATTPIGATVADQDIGVTPFNAGALANVVGDLVVGFGWVFNNAVAPGIGWTDGGGGALTEVQDDTNNPGGGADTYASYAEKAGTGSNITPQYAWTADEDNGIIGIVIKAAAGSASASISSSASASVSASPSGGGLVLMERTVFDYVD